MTKYLTHGLLGAGLMVALAAPAHADPTEPGGGFDRPAISLSAGLWSHDRDFAGPTPIAVTGVTAREAGKPSAGLQVFGEAWAQTDSDGRTDADLRQAWARLGDGPFTVTLGRQVVVWGRADRLNPTDVIGSRDYTRLLASDDEQRRGVLMARAAYGAGPWTVTAIWLPEFRPNRFPVDRSTPGVVLVEAEHPHDGGQVALHLDHSGQGLDWSLTYFRGVDRTRDLALVALPTQAPPGSLVAVQEQYPDVQVVGADLAGTHGRWGYRAEAAFTDVRGADTPFRRNDNLWTVIGLDRTFDSGWNVNVQYALRHVFNFRNPQRLLDPRVRAVALETAVVNNQLDRNQNSFTLRAARRGLHDALEVEFAAQANMETHDVALRPKVSYAFSDAVRGVIGADLFFGRQLSYFGRVRDLSAVYLQLTYAL